MTARKATGAARARPAARARGEVVAPPATAIVHVSAEYAPWAREGSLGYAVSELARAQAAGGRTVLVIVPAYPGVRDDHPDLVPVGVPFEVRLGNTSTLVSLLGELDPADGAPGLLFVDHRPSFDRAGIYGDAAGPYEDNAQRFALFSRAAVQVALRMMDGPTVIHAHDWHAALALVYLRADGALATRGAPAGAVLSVHDAAYQGHLTPDMMPVLGLPQRLFNHHELEWYGRVNLLKGGLAFADVVTATSRTHADELRSAEGGFGLHGMFARLGSDFRGIDDGLDAKAWNPATDGALVATFGPSSAAARARSKAALQRAVKWPLRVNVPLIVVPGPHTRRSGVSLALASAVVRDGPARVLFTGPAEGSAREAIAALAAAHPDRIAAIPDCSERLLRRALAGADVVAMPSLYEPGTMPAFRALRYGAVVVGRRTGALVDALDECDDACLFDAYTAEALDAALGLALDRARDRVGAVARVRAALARDSGWAQAVAADDAVYQRALDARSLT